MFKLHDRSTDKAGARFGLSCDDDVGLRVGDRIPLIEPRKGAFGRMFLRRPTEEINRSLSLAYGSPVDMAPREALLDRIALNLTKGDIAQAQILSLLLRLPDLDEAGAERLAKAERLLRFNPDHDDQGRFASGPGDSGGHARKTPSGRTYSTAIALSATQARAVGAIVDYGVAHHRGDDEIKIAVDMAYVESQLGTQLKNSSSSALGLFQYLSGSWTATHGDLDRNSMADQIAAMYQDIAHYRTRYLSGQDAGAIPATVSFPSYVRIKHRLGPNGTGWSGAVVQTFRSRSAELGFGL